MKKFPLILLLALFVFSLGICVWWRLSTLDRHWEVDPAKPAVHVEYKAAPATAVARVSPTPATATKTDKPEGVNAADFYKNAYALYQALSEREKYILKHPTEELDAKEAAALYAKMQAIMDLLRQAKNEATYADWGIPIARIDTEVPQITAAKQLGDLARWSAGYRFNEDPAGALDDLMTQSMLARSVGGSALIGSLVANSLDREAADLIHDHLGDLSPALMEQASLLLNTEPRLNELTGAMAAEAAAIQATAEMWQDPNQRQTLLSMISQSIAAGGSTWTPAELLEQGATFQGQANLAAQIDQQFAEKLLQPGDQFASWLATEQQATQGQALAGLTVSVLDSARDGFVSTMVDRAMLNAGMSILQGGPGSAGSIVDPSTGQPFTYVQTVTGFELRSPFSYKSKPIVMTFTAPGK